MVDNGYQDRIREEYKQTKERYEKLKKFNVQLEADELKGNYNTTGPRIVSLLREQQRVMEEYLHILEVRAAFGEFEL